MTRTSASSRLGLTRFLTKGSRLSEALQLGVARAVDEVPGGGHPQSVAAPLCLLRGSWRPRDRDLSSQTDVHL